MAELLDVQIEILAEKFLIFAVLFKISNVIVAEAYGLNEQTSLILNWKNTKAFRNKICKSPETYFLMIIRNRLPEYALSDEGESGSLCFPKSRKKSTKSAKNPKKRKKFTIGPAVTDIRLI